MAEGTIKKLIDKGFGFINTKGSKDLFFHSKSLQGVKFEELHEGQRVSYVEGQGTKGPCAEQVKVLNELEQSETKRERQQFDLLITAIAEEGVSADRVRHHLVELYKALNEYSLAQYGTHLTREGFKRLVFQGTGVHV